MKKSNFNSLQELLQNSVALYGDNTAFSFVDSSPISYNQLNTRISKIQTMLYGLGVKPGDRVAILSHNMPNWGMVYFAVTTMGAVIVPLLPDFSPTEVENVLNHSGSKVLFVSRRLKNKTDVCALESMEYKIELDNFFVFEGDSTVNYEAPAETHTVKSEDLAAIVYTSGTTGKSKGVMLTHGNLTAQLTMVQKVQPVNSNDTFLSILPLPHMYECALGLLLPVMNGASIYYLEKPPTPSVLLPAVRKIRPTYMLSVPMVIEKIYRNNILPTIQKSAITRLMYKMPFTRKIVNRSAAKKLYATFGGRLKFFGIGGAKLDSTVEQFLYEGKVFPYAIGYGLTETAPLVAAATPSNVKHESTGFKLSGIEMVIHDPSTTTGEGEIWVRGKNVMKGYYKEEGLTNEVLTPDGWFKTGDLGSINNKGRLYIKGRLKNVILGASGENIYPEEIESVINNFKFVQESLVLEEKGKLVAMVRFNYEDLEKQYEQFKEEFKQGMEQKRLEAEQKIEQLKLELKEYVNSRVNRFSQISVVVALQEEFEKTSTQKIKRYLYVQPV